MKTAQIFFDKTFTAIITQGITVGGKDIRMNRTSLQSIKVRYRDYYYYKEKGWFESDYYFDTNLGPVKELAGHFLDYPGRSFGKIFRLVIRKNDKRGNSK